MSSHAHAPERVSPITPITHVLMSEPVTVAMIAAAGGSVAGLAALIVGFLNHLREKRKGTTAELRGLIEELKTDRDAQAEQLRLLRSEVSAMKEGRRTDEIRIRHLEDRARDDEELLADYADHVVLTDAWWDEGATPPRPSKSWRIRKDLELRAHQQEGTG